MVNHTLNPPSTITRNRDVRGVPGCLSTPWLGQMFFQASDTPAYINALNAREEGRIGMILGGKNGQLEVRVTVVF